MRAQHESKRRVSRKKEYNIHGIYTSESRNRTHVYLTYLYITKPTSIIGKHIQPNFSHRLLNFKTSGSSSIGPDYKKQRTIKQ